MINLSQRINVIPIPMVGEFVRILQTSKPKVAVKESVLIFIPSEPRVMGRETEKDLDQMTYISHADSDEDR